MSLNVLIQYIPTNICVLYKIMGHIGFEVTVCPLAECVGIPRVERQYYLTPNLSGSLFGCSLVVNKICMHPFRLAVICDDLIGLGRPNTSQFSSSPLYTDSNLLASKP